MWDVYTFKCPECEYRTITSMIDTKIRLLCPRHGITLQLEDKKEVQ